MKRLVCLCGITLIAASSFAADSAVLDQHYDLYAGLASGAGQAQTFVVGISGWLTRVEVAIRPAGVNFDPSRTAEAQLSIVKTVNHVPRALPDDILTSSTVTFPQPGFELSEPNDFSPVKFRWVPFDLPSIPVTAGEELGIAMRSPMPHQYEWACNFDPNSYPLGDAYAAFSADLTVEPYKLNSSRGNADFLFRTFVIPVPEPASCSLLMAAMVFGGLAMLKQRKETGA